MTLSLSGLIWAPPTRPAEVLPCEQRPAEVFLQTGKALSCLSLSNKQPPLSLLLWTPSHLLLKGDPEGRARRQPTSQPRLLWARGNHAVRSSLLGKLLEANRLQTETIGPDWINSLSCSASSRPSLPRCCPPSNREPEAEAPPSAPQCLAGHSSLQGGPRHARVPDLQQKNGKHLPWWWSRAGWSLCPPRVWSPRVQGPAGPRFGAWCLLARPFWGGGATSVPERNSPLCSRGSVLAGPRPGSFIPAPEWRHWPPLLPPSSHQGELQLWKKETRQTRGSLQTRTGPAQPPRPLGRTLKEASGYISHHSLSF